MTAQARDATNSDARSRFRRFWYVMRLVLLGLLFVLGTAFLLLFPELQRGAIYDLSVGDIAVEDIRAPRDITFVSQIETEEARERAAQSVEDIYDPPESRIRREQVRRARAIMDFMADVRADPYADSELKQSYLDAITMLTLSPEASVTLLQTSDNHFDLVEREVVSLIEETMSGTVEEGNVPEATSQLDLKVSPDLPESLIPVVVSIARDLIVPNSTLNTEATAEVRRETVAAIEPVERSYQMDEIVVRAGERIDELDMEALKVLGLTSQRLTWRNAVSALLISLVSIVVLSVYLGIFEREWLDSTGRLLLIVLLLMVFLAGAQVFVPGAQQAIYLFPVAAPVLALTALVGTDFGVVVAIVMAILLGYMTGGSLEVATFAGISGLMAAGTLRRTTRLNAYFLAGLAAAAAGVAALMIFELPANAQPAQLVQVTLMATINGLLSAGLALIILFLIGNVTGITTSLKLIDLMRPDYPLQRRLQQEALGTYQHTLSVANIAETAAEAIGADSLLTRVGTLYHDIGKMRNPGFFIENRAEGAPDPHRGLSPLASARIIRAHVSDGLDMARRYRLPPRVVEFIAEHHGTMPIMYFLHKAREEAEAAGVELDEAPFFYDGPAPQSCETAILMLSDGCESATRANRPSTGDEIEEIVTRIIQQRLDAHQLDDSGLTLTDIKMIQESIIRTLKGMYHPRVQYPGDKKPGALGTGQGGELPPGAGQDVTVPGVVTPKVAEEALAESAEKVREEEEEMAALHTGESQEGDGD